MGSYLVIKNGQQIGPYDESEIIRQITEGILNPGDLCWQQGMSDWQPISSFLNYGATSQNHPPVIPSTTAIHSNSYLHIPIARLIVMCIVTFGLYEVYWMFMNINYIKKRDNLRISPFWRAVFGVFYCHNLLWCIHEDPEYRSIETPTFSARGLATWWVILAILSNIMGKSDNAWAPIISAFIPSFLCFVPVQRYINTVREKQYPGLQYFGWSTGQIILLVTGCILWPLFILGAIGQAFTK